MTLLLLLGVSVIYTVSAFDLGFVFRRINDIEEKNASEGGITIERIIDGTAFNRGTAFDEGYRRYASKGSWIIGYGWGVGRNNRDAYFVDPTILRTSAHSQLFAVLFILGWIGFIAYFGLLFRIIFKSYKTLGNKRIAYSTRLMALFFMVAFTLYFLNEIKADSINYPTYFGVTIIWMGLAFSVNNQNFLGSNKMQTIKESDSM